MSAPIAALLLLVPAIPAADDALPAPSALFARYHANFRAFSTLKVEWRRDQRTTDEQIAAEQARIDALQARIDAIDSSHPTFHEINRQLQVRRAVLATVRAPKHLF